LPKILNLRDIPPGRLFTKVMEYSQAQVRSLASEVKRVLPHFLPESEDNNSKKRQYNIKP
jgi:hypothetical protein